MDIVQRSGFVISPIGPEGSQIREHADDVFSYIIKPAMDACGIEAYRSDHLHEPGRISEQMFRAILGADVCVAVLTGYNPNVFYELAIAQAFERPVIILIEKGQVLPFDIHDLRSVYYDFKPRALFERVYVDEIVAHVRSLEAAGWRVSSPFGASLAKDHFGFSEDMAADGFVSLSREDAGFNLIFLHTGLATFKPERLRGRRADGLLVVFVVDDIDGEYARLRAGGVSITTPSKPSRGGSGSFRSRTPTG